MPPATGVCRAARTPAPPIPIVPDADITLTVAGSQVSGRSACNQYGGEIVVKDGQVQFGPLMMTEMACAEPIMASEAAYAAALAGVRAATRDGDRLTLTGDGVELVFERVVPAPDAELVDTDWILDSIIARDAVSSVMGEPASLRLAADGTLSGSTGCRTFMGRYTLADDTLTIADLATDRRACADDLVQPGRARDRRPGRSAAGRRPRPAADPDRPGRRWSGLCHPGAGDPARSVAVSRAAPGSPKPSHRSRRAAAAASPRRRRRHRGRGGRSSRAPGASAR